MNLRDIKKDIEFFVGAFIDDCSLFLEIKPEADAPAITDLIDKAVDLYNDSREKIGKADGNKKTYYNGLREEVLQGLDGLYEELSDIIKSSAKEEA